jgi:predicted metal-dependent hydrolase
LSELAIIAFTGAVQFQLNPGLADQNTCPTSLLVGQRQVPLALVRNPRARRYVLRLRRDGVARVTIPRGGSIAEAKAFAERSADWLERQWHRLAAQSSQLAPWRIGSAILFRGETVLIEAGLGDGPPTICVESECVRVSETALDLRPAVENHFRRLAERELPPRVFELASLHQLKIHRVSVRNQKSRWGSCSRRGTISLNWRLLQTPAFVRDYIILHELMHLRQMNHSTRFWREVGCVCPDYKAAELWLKRHSRLLTQ